MAEGLIVFLVQFGYVLLLGLQSRNVYYRDYWWSAVTSLLLGVSGLYLTSMVAKAAILGGKPFVQLAYIAAGPVGIVTAIWIHPYLRRMTEGRDERSGTGDEDRRRVP